MRLQAGDAEREEVASKQGTFHNLIIIIILFNTINNIVTYNVLFLQMDRIVDCLRDRLDLSVYETGEKTVCQKTVYSIIFIQECDCRYFNRRRFLFSNNLKWEYMPQISF